MIMLDLFIWWYGAGWASTVTGAKRRFSTLSDMFSLTILLRTLFSPWRRIITYPGAGLEARMRAFGDNLVSRCIGFTVRFFVLLAAAVACVLVALFSAIEIVFWPLVPLAGAALIIWGLV